MVGLLMTSRICNDKEKEGAEKGGLAISAHLQLAFEHWDLDGTMESTVYIFVFPLAKCDRDRLSRNADGTR